MQRSMLQRTITQRTMIVVLALLLALLVSGCSHTPPPARQPQRNSSTVLARLADQLQQWRGTAYRYGGMSKRGVDCSGFVQLTFRDKFATLLPRETSQQARTGKRIRKSDLQPGDLVFFKTGHGESGLHVGIYDGNNQFIHASTSHGVTRSSLNNPYWRKHFWQARRLDHLH